MMRQSRWNRVCRGGLVWLALAAVPRVALALGGSGSNFGASSNSGNSSASGNSNSGGSGNSGSDGSSTQSSKSSGESSGDHAPVGSSSCKPADAKPAGADASGAPVCPQAPPPDPQESSMSASSSPSSGDGSRKRKLIIPMQTRNEAAQWLAGGGLAPQSALLRATLSSYRRALRADGRLLSEREVVVRMLESSERASGPR